jgi:hypothetical protein
MENDDDGNTWIRIPRGHDIFVTEIEGACDQCYANARLIAAAPDLLEACKEACKYLALLQMHHPHLVTAEILATLEYAILKAKAR